MNLSGGKTIVPFEKALTTVLDSACLLGTERVDIAHAANRILAEDVKSDIDMPPFDKSAMDGFACRRADLANELSMVESIRAGYVPKKTVGPNQCSKIMTGGVVPPGADCVIMKEYVEIPTENTVRFIGEETADNICQKGEDIKTGDIVLRRGTRLEPQHIAVLASVGKAQPMVAKRPRVAVIATGDELVEPASKPGPAQTRNSNSFQLAAQAKSTGSIATNYGVAGDTTGHIDSMFKKATEENDVVIFSGGVSVGDFDLVPEILKQNGIDLLFEKIAIKPGKPTVFGVSERVYCFGLPGNPVSTFVLFEILVKPFLYKLMAYNYRSPNVQMPLGETLRRKKTIRQRWFPVAITETGTVKPVEYHGSAHINSLSGADGLVSMGVGIAEIEKGTIVPVRLI
ncbi:MAG: molybdopterin molybdotransferase MoeA [Planctomycetota bacterium]